MRTSLPCVLLAFALCSAVSSAAAFQPWAGSKGPSGTSAIVFTPAGAVLRQNGFMEVSYTVQLTSGTYNTTYISITDKAQLTAEGINISAYAGGIFPPYTGTMQVSVSGRAQPRAYNITMQATGADPSSPANFTLTVPPQNSTSTTTAPTTSSATTSSAATTVAAPTANMQFDQYAEETVGGVLAIIMVIYAVSKLRGQGRPNTPAADARSGAQNDEREWFRAPPPT